MLNRWVRRLGRFLGRDRLAREMADEMRAHIELETAERMRAGASPAEARREALRAFGGEDRWWEEARAARGWRGWDELRQDVGYGLRSLRGSPGFTAAAVLTLTLGIGATTAVFSVVNGVLLRPLGLGGSERVVRMFEYPEDEVGVGHGTISYANFADMRERSRLWEHAAAFDEWQVSLLVDGVAERYDGGIVDADFFRVLGVEPALGRFFGPEEATPGGPSRVVLSWGLWQERFGGDAAVLGRVIETNGYDSEVIGVAPPGFEDPALSGTAFGTPRRWRSPAEYFATNSRGSRSFTGVVRLKPGVTLAQAQQEAAALHRQLAAEYPDNNAKRAVRLVSLKETIVGPVRLELLVLLGAVALVLLIACANVGNLSLVRATARQRELSLRTALGASRGRLVRQLLLESTLLSLAGAALGGALAWLGTRALGAWLASHLPRAGGVVPDLRVLGFALLVTVAAALVFGMLPALHGSRVQLGSMLRAGDRSMAGSRAQGRLRAAVVASEVALAVVVLVGAGLLTRSLLRLQAVDPGLEAREHAIALELALPAEYEEDRLTPYYARLFEALHGIPGVVAVGGVDVLPMGGSFNGAPFTIVGRPEPPLHEQPDAEVRAAVGSLFEALGVPLLRGRLPGPQDQADAPPTVVVSRTLAERYFPGEDALGQRIRSYDHDRTIVGIVGDVAQFTLDQPPTPVLYFPGEQAPGWMRDDPTLVVRFAAGSPIPLPALRATVHRLDPRVAVANVRSLERVVDETLVLPRFRTALLLLFAAIAFVLAVVGIYGTVAYTVARRTREFGIRIALGAQRTDILSLVLGRGLLPVLVGIGGGLLLSLAATRVVQSLLYGISPLDGWTYLVVPGALMLVSALAAAVPARRAAGLAPVRSLREE